LDGRIAKAERIATRRNDHVQDAYGDLRQAAAARAHWLVSNKSVTAAWALLSGEALSQEALTAVQRTLEREEEIASEAARLVAQARSAQNASLAALQRRKLEADVKDLDRRHTALRGPLDDATATLDALETYQATYVGQQLDRLMPLVRPLFFRLHANRVFDELRTGGIADPLRWKADADGHAFDPSQHFSQGQRQDLALALFLARACVLKGTFFLDEPLVHLDDLNRVAALDVLRAITLTRPDVQLVFTTANRQLALHLREKFARRPHLLHVIELEGNPRQAVRHSDQTSWRTK
jgi:DNA repair exonuclease SbcCD ATPase subunit